MINNIKTLLQKNNMTQKELSIRTGIHESSISRYVTGDVLKRYYMHSLIIADILHVPVTDLFTEDDTNA